MANPYLTVLKMLFQRKPLVTSCITFVASPPSTASLRGEGYWTQASVGLQWIFNTRRWLNKILFNRVKDHPGKILINKNLVPPCPQTLLFIILQAEDKILELMEDYRALGAVVIYDVTGAIWDFAFMEETHSKEAFDYWCSPKIQKNFRACLLAADVITTSFANMVPDLEKLSGGRTVIHLPDCYDNKDSLFAYGRRVDFVVQTAIKQRLKTVRGVGPSDL